MMFDGGSDDDDLDEYQVTGTAENSATDDRRVLQVQENDQQVINKGGCDKNAVPEGNSARQQQSPPSKPSLFNSSAFSGMDMDDLFDDDDDEDC